MMSENRSPQTEEEVPKTKTSYALAENNRTKDNEKDRDWFNTIKGHNLLGWCVALIFFIYLFELFKNNGHLSEIAKDIIEIIKLLMFSLTGYLFGTSGKDK